MCLILIIFSSAMWTSLGFEFDLCVWKTLFFYKDFKLSSDSLCKSLIFVFLSLTSSDDNFVVYEKDLNLVKIIIEAHFLWYFPLQFGIRARSLKGWAPNNV